MTFHDDNWSPSPELLAAYFDGECEGRDELELLKRRIEEWLAVHPPAQDELAMLHKLLDVWQDTPPPEPAPEKWTAMVSSLPAMAETCRNGLVKTRFRRIAWLGSAAAAVVLCLVIVQHPWRVEHSEAPVTAQNPAPHGARLTDPDDEILAVANATEVTIVRVEGADTQTLVVGELPVQGNLELAAPGDVVLGHIRPDPTDHLLPEFRLNNTSTPIIFWAKLDEEE